MKYPADQLFTGTGDEVIHEGGAFIYAEHVGLAVTAAVLALCRDAAFAVDLDECLLTQKGIIESVAVLKVILCVAFRFLGHLEDYRSDSLVDQLDETELLKICLSFLFSLEPAGSKYDERRVVPGSCLCAVDVGSTVEIRQIVREVFQSGVEDLFEA